MAEPIHISRKRNFGNAVPSLIFGAVWCGMISFFLVMVLQSPGDEGATAALPMIILFFLVGIGIMAGGLRTVHDTEINISQNEVYYQRTGLLRKPVQWSEPLVNYSGILSTSRLVSRGKHNHVTYFDVIIQHRNNKNKSLLLESYRDQHEQRMRLEYFCKETGLSLLEEDSEGIIRERKAESLDKKIDELVAEGNIKRTHASRQPYPGKKYRLMNVPGGFGLYRTYPMALLWGILFYLGAASVIYFNYPDWFDLGGLVFVLCIFGTIFSFSSRSREAVIVSNGKIIYGMHLFGKFKMKQTVIPLDKIEEIVVTHDYNMGNVKRFNKGIKVASDEGTFFFAHYTSDKEREWIADKLIEVCSLRRMPE
jgi:hypothetical protein